MTDELDDFIARQTAFRQLLERIEARTAAIEHMAREIEADYRRAQAMGSTRAKVRAALRARRQTARSLEAARCAS